MLVKYDIAITDVVAFSRHVMNSPTSKKNKRRWIIVVIFLITGSLFIPLPEEIPRSMVVELTVAWSALFLLALFVAGPAASDRYVRGVYKTGANRGTIGEHEIEIDEDGLVERTEVSETRQSWRGVERIDETETHAFFFVSPLMAYIIPKQSIITGDPVTFIATAKTFWRSANFGNG